MNDTSTLGQMLPFLLETTKGVGEMPTLPLGPEWTSMSQKDQINMLSMLAQAAYFKTLAEGFDGKRKVVIHPFNFPPEILHALGIAPVFIEMLSTMASTAPNEFPDNIFKYLDSGYEAGLPGTLCAGQLGGAGALLYGDWPRPDLILCAAPGFCDVNSKILEYTARTLDIPLLYVDMSPYQDERGLGYYQQSFREVISRLEELSGTKLDPGRLKEAAENTNRATELYNEIAGLQAAVPSPVPNSYITLNTSMKFMLGGRPEAIPVYESVLSTAKEKVAKGEGALEDEKIRCLMLYTSIYYDGEFHGWLEDKGVSLIMDILSYFPLRPVDTSSTEAIIEGFAEMAINYPMARQMKGPLSEPGGWDEDMVFLARKYKADCCVFSGNPACKRANGSLRLVSDRLKEEVGIPTLNLEADSWDRRVVGMATIKERVLDFLEAIE